MSCVGIGCGLKSIGRYGLRGSLPGSVRELIVEALMMSRLITLAASVVMAAAVLVASATAQTVGTANSCNKINGCMWDFIYENQMMKQSGLLTKAMEEGRANKEAFEALREWERTHGTAPSNLR